MHQIKILGQKQKDHACELIQALPDGQNLIRILKIGDVRSPAQNSLYWVLVTQLAGEHGMSKDEVHVDMKKRIIIPIMSRDDPDGFGQMLEAIRNLYRQDKNAGQFIYDQAVDLISTTRLTVEQFSEVIDDIIKDSFNRGIHLQFKDDLYKDAMGR